MNFSMLCTTKAKIAVFLVVILLCMHYYVSLFPN